VIVNLLSGAVRINLHLWCASGFAMVSAFSLPGSQPRSVAALARIVERWVSGSCCAAKPRLPWPAGQILDHVEVHGWYLEQQDERGP
jgi:hypothetical protein